MKLLVFIEHFVVSLFSYGFLTPLASCFLLDKMFLDKATSRRLYENFSETKNLPEGRWSGLFYLTVLGNVTEDYTW